MNRRELLTVGAVAIAAPILMLTKGWGSEGSAIFDKCGIILVVDETIPYLSVYQQFDIIRAHNISVGRSRLGDDCCFGLYGTGDGSKKFANSCAQTCNAFIAQMRCYGFEKVAVMVWSRRLGPMLTIPLKTRADIMLVRAYGPSTVISRSASPEPILSHLDGLESRMVRNGRPYILRVEPHLNFKSLHYDELTDFNICLPRV